MKRPAPAFRATLSILTLVFLATAFGSGCSARSEGERAFRQGGGQAEEERKEEAVPVEVAALERGSIEAALRYSATLEAERDVQVFAEAPRRVVELLVEEGDRVGKGQLLVRLQDDEQRSNLAKAELDLDQARREFDRQKSLFEQKLISEQVFIDARTTFETSELALSDARRELDYTQVRAPIAGTVTERLVNLGDYVTVNQALFRIVDFDSIVARIYVPEKELPRLAPGLPARLEAEALGSHRFTGTVDRIAPVVDPGTGTVKVTVATPRQQGLRPGMYVQVELVAAVHDDVVLIPKRAVVYDNDQMFVFRLGDERRVARIRLESILESADWVEPGPGFELGDEVVVAGQSGLKDGALVRLPGDPDPSDEEEGEEHADGEDNDGQDSDDGEQA